MNISIKSTIVAFLISIGSLSFGAQAQGLLQNQKFTHVTIFEGNVIFLKEMPLVDTNHDSSFSRLKAWCKENYASDPIISGIRYDNTNREVVIKSKIELILPVNSKGVKEKVVMSYHLNTFIFNNNCIAEIKDISYVLPGNKKKTKAESVITDYALATKDNQQELRMNIQKGTLYFLNELTENIQNAVNTLPTSDTTQTAKNPE